MLSVSDCVRQSRKIPDRKSGNDMGKKIRLVGVLLGSMLLLSACKGKEEEKELTPTPVPTTGQEQPTEPAPSVTPAQGGLVFRLETEEYSAKEGEVEVFHAKLVYPVFEGGCADVLNEFVLSMIGGFRLRLPLSEENARLNYAEFSGEDIEYAFPEAEELDITIAAETEKWISFSSLWYGNTGGPHPNTYCKTYVREKADGSEVKIEEYLEQYGLTLSETAAYAAEQVRAVSEEGMFWDEEGLPGAFLKILEEDQWYLTEKGLMLFANPYELAAYVYGKIEYEIPYEVLQQGLKNQ